jgi:hypothetical protein
MDFQFTPCFYCGFLVSTFFDFYFFVGVGAGLGGGLGAGLFPLFGPDGLPVLLGQFGFCPVFFAIDLIIKLIFPTR